MSFIEWITSMPSLRVPKKSFETSEVLKHAKHTHITYILLFIWITDEAVLILVAM